MRWRAYDPDREVRKHLWFGLERLGARGRVAFLSRLCRLVQGPGGHEVKVTTHTGTVQETYQDVQTLCYQHGLAMERAASELEVELRKR